jgi:hypothetical protein
MKMHQSEVCIFNFSPYQSNRLKCKTPGSLGRAYEGWDEALR